MKFCADHLMTFLAFDDAAALAEAKRNIHDAFNKWGVGHLAAKVKIVWNDRLTSTAGRANSTLIELSYHLWIHMDEAERKNIAIHEAAHAAAHAYYKRRIQSHGWEWRRMMLMIGENPSRCHDIKVHELLYGKEKVRKQRAKVQGYCGCPDGVPVGTTRARRIRTGEKKYRCNRCKQVVRLEK